ncbi:MAG: HU family DNA-binding protein, partial [Muribaculaceae bacterium]|nr:HU family DNA-binding protein [Muribaculaceae bacterium]
MGSKITLAQFAQLMSSRSGLSVKDCETFLRSLFRNISSGLESDGIVKIKEIGTFKLLTVASRKSVDVNTGVENEIPSHRKVSFIPSKELAVAVNAPFEMFETVEISEDINEDDIMQDELTDNDFESAPERPADDIKEVSDEVEATSLVPTMNMPDVAADRDEEKTDNSSVGSPEEKVEENVNVKEQELESNSEQQMESDENKVEIAPSEPVKRRRGFGHGFMWGIVVALLTLAVGGGVLYFMFKDRYVIVQGSNPSDTLATLRDDGALVIDEGENQLLNIDDGEPTVMEDADMEGNTVPTTPSDPVPVYDTITDTRYLTTIAKEHYGNYHLWPYIYKENSNI